MSLNTITNPCGHTTLAPADASRDVALLRAESAGWPCVQCNQAQNMREIADGTHRLGWSWGRLPGEVSR